MATAINFKAEQAANAILRNDKAKLEWNKLPLTQLPKDLQSLAIAALNAQLAPMRPCQPSRAASMTRSIAPLASDSSSPWVAASTPPQTPS